MATRAARVAVASTVVTQNAYDRYDQYDKLQLASEEAETSRHQHLPTARNSLQQHKNKV